jgi:D-amino peptidase
MEDELKRLIGFLIVLISVPLLASCVFSQNKAPLRVYISVDMEGITDVVNPAQLGPEGFEYAEFRKIMTGEVNAAIEGALLAGATQITVADSHGNGLNILPEELNPTARLIRSWPRPLEMMEGIDGGFDAALFIGYHASVNTVGAVRAHTISSKRFYDLRLNGKHVSEALLNAAIAGHFGVPVVLLSGDDKIVDEVHQTVDSNIVGVVVKRAIGYHSADSLSPKMAREIIRNSTTNALKRVGSFRPFKMAGPVRLEISFKTMINAELLSLLPNIERVDGSTIAFTGKDILEVIRFISFATNYDSNL